MRKGSKTTRINMKSVKHYEKKKKEIEQERKERQKIASVRHLKGTTPNKQNSRNILRQISMLIAPYRHKIEPNVLAEVVNELLSILLNNTTPHKTRYLLRVINEEADKAKKAREENSKRMRKLEFSGQCNRNKYNHAGAKIVSRVLANGVSKTRCKLQFPSPV